MAIAHQQIASTDPLRFYVTKDKDIVINPVITRHTNHTVDSREGCLSFPDQIAKIVQRWNKCEVIAITLDDDNKFTEPEVLELSGRDAFVCQHEIQHFNCEYIFKIKKNDERQK